MSMYPSLEDMKVDQMARVQMGMGSSNFNYGLNIDQGAPSAPPPSATLSSSGNLLHMYPALNDYMGIEFTQDVIEANMPEYLPVATSNSSSDIVQPTQSSYPSLVAPLSGVSPGFHRAQVTHGVREMVLCKDADGKVGVRVKDIDKGVFVSLVKKDSPAALAGLRFGDQILQINGKDVAGMSMESVHDKFRKCSNNGISLVVRDRPFERTVTLHKDSTGHIGFQFTDGQVTAIVKDSSAARNGLLINHHLLEVNGQNVVGLKDRRVSEIIDEAGQVVTITIMPSFVYKHIVKKMASSLVTKLMDHSVPEF